MNWLDTTLSYIGLTRSKPNPSEASETSDTPTRNAITPIAPGLPNDGINTPITSAGGIGDRPFAELRTLQLEALEAWRSNPLARRIVGMITAYVVGDGIQISSNYPPLQKFCEQFATHARNNLALRQPDLCSELTRSGELFVVLFPDTLTGIPHLRLIPSSQIDKIEWQPGDYETETRYHQIPTSITQDDLQGTWWHTPHTPHPSHPSETSDPSNPTPTPIVLHYAINRPAGILRGEGDLTPILTWLRRYTRWLEDRIRLNAGTRAFLWIVKATKALKSSIEERYRTPPEPGSIIVAEQGAEDWTAISPNLHANDAANDGRAIRWMVAAGGPGTGLVDLGEGQDANLATATAMQEQRRRFLRQRQAYFAWILADITLNAWNLYTLESNRRHRPVTLSDLIIETPDISPEDSAKLSAAARDLTQSFKQLEEIVGTSQAIKRFALRLFAKFVGEQLTQEESTAILNGTPTPTQSEVTSQ